MSSVLLRVAFERVSRNLVLRRELPARVGSGSIFVSPDSALKFWRRDLDKTDPRLFDWAKEFVKQDDVVWDVGANVGLFTFAAANLAGINGCVLAIEPDPWLADLLRKSASLPNPNRGHVDVLATAISDSVGTGSLFVASRGRSANHLSTVQGSTQSGGLREAIHVSTVSLDHLLLNRPAPNVLKIDVEGAEYHVLAGAHKLLSGIGPTILCEVSSENTARIGNLLHSYDYELFDLELLAEARRPLSAPTFNTLATRRDSVHSVTR